MSRSATARATPAAPFEGPLELTQFPSTLSARVVTPGPSPRLHGYAMRTDLARNYGTDERFLLSLTGELPSVEQARAFSVACWFFAEVSVADASVHAAVLSSLCGASSNAVIGAASLALAEHARFEVAQAEELLEWLKARDGDLPAACRAQPSSTRDELDTLAATLAANALAMPAFPELPTLTAALWALLYDAGLVRPEQLEAALVFARLPIALAEAFAQTACQFASYPTNLPRYSYQP